MLGDKKPRRINEQASQISFKAIDKEHTEQAVLKAMPR